MTNLELTSAFAALLGAPLDTFPTTSKYVVYSWADEMSTEALDDLINGDLDAVARGELIEEAWEPDEPQLSWNVFPVDHGRSLWTIENSALDEFGEPAAEAVRAAGTANSSQWVVTGSDLARVLAAHDVDIEADELVSEVQFLRRIATDGTLFDAMRHATWTHGGPDTLVPLERGVEVEPHWDEALRVVTDPRLRDHLRMLCLTAHHARSDGAYYLGRDCSFDLKWIADRPGHEVLAGWEFGEGQGALTVFAIKQS